MTLVLRSLTIAVMLLHSVCGCCWHHDHGSCCASESAPHRAAEEPAPPATTSHCCHGHHHDHELPLADETSHPAEDSDHEHPGEPCRDEVCVYVTSKAPVLSQPVLFFLADLPNDPGLVSGISLSRPVLGEIDPPPLYESALAACALLQVWRL